MFTCHSCMRRCLQAIFEDFSISSSTRPSTRIFGRRTFALRRSFFTSSCKSQTDEPHDHLKKTTRAHGFSRANSRQEWLDSRGTRPPTKPAKPPSTKITSASSHALRFLKKDPLKLAEYIREILRSDDFDTAIEAVRDASKGIQCVVSWNHLIGWQLSKGKMNGAIKIYNEMKKRAQSPDAHTYTIIFRGCAEHPDSSQALAKVLTIYQSMLSEKASVKPNTIHMNAILKMCARARDIDAMMTIVSHLPEKGVRAANNLTFTTILNALRINAVGDFRSTLTPLQKRQNAKQGILQARHIWQDITTRWRAGDIWIDEELVCTMGRMLLLSEDDKDLDDIFNLIQQTMQIARPVSCIGTPRQSAVEPVSQGHHRITRDNDVDEDESLSESATAEQVQGTLGQSDDGGSDVGTSLSTHNLSVSAQVGIDLNKEHLDSVSPPEPSAKGISVFARPGQNSLSLVLEASRRLNVKDAGKKYWDLFTKDHKVVPDKENYTAYLRLLRIARASTEAVQIMLEMPLRDMEIKTFRLAIAACKRDKNNHHAFSNAGKVLDLMQTALKQPDIKVLVAYLELAMEAPVYTTSGAQHGQREISATGYGRQIMRALQRLDPSLLNLKSALFFGHHEPALAGKVQPGTPDRAELKSQTRTLVARMVAAYNLLITKPLATTEEIPGLIAGRNKLSAFLNRSSMKRSTDTTLRSILPSNVSRSRSGLPRLASKPRPSAGNGGKLVDDEHARSRQVLPDS